MIDNPVFSYQEFEDYLFSAIRESRSLSVGDVLDSENVFGYLRLAKGEVERFLRDVNSFHKEQSKLESTGM
jgi:hypothetical protein